MRIITSFLFLFLFLCINAQLSTQGRGKYAFDFDLGPKVSFGNSFIINSNLNYDLNATNDFLAPTYRYGGKGGVSFIATDPRYVFFSVNAEYLMGSSAHKLILEPNTGGTTEKYTKDLAFKTTELAVIFRVIGFVGDRHTRGRYFEIGPKFSTFSSFSETNDSDAAWLYTNATPGYTPAANYNPTFTSLCFGFGYYGSFYHFGLRGTYGISDIMTNDNYVVSDGYYPGSVDFTENYGDYNPTKFFSVEAVLELNLYFLEVGTASCGRLAVDPFPLFVNTNYIW